MLTIYNLYEARKYCCEDISHIEGYNEAILPDSGPWVCHHRLGIELGLDHNGLEARGLYYGRPASELLFMRRSEHGSIHNRGENNPMYGKHRTEDTKRKISDAKKGVPKSDEHKRKLRMNSRKIPIQAFKDGVLVGTYESQIEAARRLGCSRTSILDVLNGRSSHHRGYTFRRAS